MADYPVQTIAAEIGADLTMNAAAAGGDTFDWQDGVYLVINNGSGGVVTLTVTAYTTSSTVDNLGDVTKTDLSVPVAAGGIGFVPPLVGAFRNSADGKVSLAWSSDTSVTFAAVKNNR